MKLILFGSTGRIGQRILLEALERGHEITAALRDPSRLHIHGTILRSERADATSAADIARVAAGHDAAISAVGPGAAGEATMIAATAQAMVEGLANAGTTRLIVVGGAGTLEIRPGVQRLDTPEYPAIYRPSGCAQRQALKLYRNSTLDWTYLSPPVMIQPGERTGCYRLGGDKVLFDAQKRSQISMEDYALALLHELETPRHVRRRFTVAY